VASAGLVILGVPGACEMTTVAVVTMSVKPAMSLGKGPWPMTIKGALTMVMLWAGAWSAWDFWVMERMPSASWLGVRAAQAVAAMTAPVVKILEKSILTVLKWG